LSVSVKNFKPQISQNGTDLMRVSRIQASGDP
jgi:hypothetical protein